MSRGTPPQFSDRTAVNALKRITRIADAVVFVCTTLAIAGVFWEGMALKWFDPVGVLVICMDYTFLPATLLHLITDRKSRRILPHFISLLMIAAALALKIAGRDYPVWTLVFWYFYIWFLYGIILAKRYCAARSDSAE